MKNIIIVLVIICSFLTVSAQDYKEKIEQTESKLIQNSQQRIDLLKEVEQFKLKQIQHDLQKIGLPKLTEGETVANHSAMSLCYSEEHEQAKWSAHIIIPDIIRGGVGRTNDFREDSLVTTGCAIKSDYWNSGFDRGHLAPSADFRWSKKALSESYFYSNMSPQRPDLNREIWADLENTVREYVTESMDQVYVVTGGVLKEGLPTIGENKVSIPELFYKAVIDIEGDTVTGVAFIIPNEATDYPVMSFAISIDSLESLTGIDFFHNLPDELEDKIESSFNESLWQIGKKKGNVKPIHRNKLKGMKKTYNSVQARSHIDERGVTVCGTVVSIGSKGKSGNLFINFDQKFPNQIFWCTIWKSDRVNFSYNPEEYLLNKRICVKGSLKIKYGQPSMILQNEKAITFMDEMEKD